MVPKIIALYLPQFYNIKENSEWYGDGFTDWVAVKEAKPLFSGHNQPKIPLNDNYYNLSCIETIKWQAKLAKEYGIDGFCFYHYWFDSQTKLLEKPAELLLAHKEIDITFCFSWANESWKRTWNNVSKGNVWCDKYDGEQKKNVKDKGLLAKQRYGREKEWQKHIEYLIPFFKDKRYLRINGKPVLCIYQPCDIPCMKAMLEIWNQNLKKEGIEGVHLIGASYGENYSHDVDISYNHEPGTAFQKCRKAKKCARNQEGTEFFDYDTIWSYILKEISGGMLSCALVDFDSSPRKGYKSIIVRGSNPQKFGQYFSNFLEKNIHMGNELVFINAWNEWGEGMHLEPCEEFGYGYLEAVKASVRHINNSNILKKLKDAGDNKGIEYNIFSDTKIQKSAAQLAILNKWFSAYRIGVRASDFFYKYGYSTVAIYGMGILGKQLMEELKDSDLKVLYYIDKINVLPKEDLRRLSIEEKLPEVDCIVVTVITEFESIYDILKEKSDASIINLNEICEDIF